MQGVSVIICCFNSASRLTDTLKHLASQKTPELQWEIIVVDNASTDTTRDTAIQVWKQLARADVPLAVVPEPKPGLSNARAKGIGASLFDTLIFCDDDNWLGEDYVAHAFRIMKRDPAIGIAGGNGIAVSDSTLPSWFEQYKGCFACYPQAVQEGELSGKNAFLYGAGMVVRKSCLVQLHERGFLPLLPDRVGTQLSSGGDTELSYAVQIIKYKLWYSPQLSFRHYLPGNRLTDDYLVRLVSAMSYCSGLLMSYDYVLADKKIDRTSWLKDTFYQGLFFLRATIKKVVRRKTLEQRIAFTFAFNRMRSILAQAGQYHHNYTQVIKLKNP